MSQGNGQDIGPGPVLARLMPALEGVFADGDGDWPAFRARLDEAFPRLHADLAALYGEAFAESVVSTLEEMRSDDVEFERWPGFPAMRSVAPVVGDSGPGRFYREAIAAGSDPAPGLKVSDRGLDDVAAMAANPDWPRFKPSRREAVLAEFARSRDE